VFTLDAESGTVRFGDGLRGRRPPPGAAMRAGYDYSEGREGNVGPGTITYGPELPPGITVTNPVRTWGGADAEQTADGERQITRLLRHRDRAVTAEDFAEIAARTPGVEVGRVEVLPAHRPGPVAEPVAGAVTLLVVPRGDPLRPHAPEPDGALLGAVAAHLDPRRLVTTEVHVRGPEYVPIWVAAGIDVVPGEGVAEVGARVRAELARVLSPLPLRHQHAPGVTAGYPHAGTGWPLGAAVGRGELAVYAARVPGVRTVNRVVLAQGGNGESERIALTGLQLPRLAGIVVTAGDPLPLDELRGTVPTGPQDGGPVLLPVPVIPEGC
jgi:predicted phage baseplate assembly protein